MSSHDRTIAPNAAAQVRRERLCWKLYALGPRAVFELLDELAADYVLDAAVDCRLERYAKLSPYIVRAVGGNRFAPPLAVLRGGRK